jgi:hypothetical protein
MQEIRVIYSHFYRSVIIRCKLYERKFLFFRSLICAQKRIFSHIDNMQCMNNKLFLLFLLFTKVDNKILYVGFFTLSEEII